MSQKIAWSFSRLDDFEKCPSMFHHKHILKDVPKPSGPALERGSAVHKSLEKAIMGVNCLPKELMHMLPFVAAVSDNYSTELQLAFTEDLRETSWFGKDVWVRVILDLVDLAGGATIQIVDWKTGNPAWGKPDQLRLFAAAAFVKWQHVEKIKCAYVWVDHKKIDSEVFTRDADFDRLWEEFRERSEIIQLANESGQWEPKPAWYCKHCPCSKLQCKFKES